MVFVNSLQSFLLSSRNHPSGLLLPCRRALGRQDLHPDHRYGTGSVVSHHLISKTLVLFQRFRLAKPFHILIPNAEASLSVPSRLYTPGRGFQTRCGFISLNAWGRVIRNPQYAVDATAGVYSFVGGSCLFSYNLTAKSDTQFCYHLKIVNPRYIHIVTYIWYFDFL